MDNHRLEENDSVFVHTDNFCWFIKLSEVRLFESTGNYTKIFFSDQSPSVHRTLNMLEERLDTKVFFRVSRKHIVNLKMITKVEFYIGGSLLLTLTGGETIQVTRRRAKILKGKMSI